VVTAEATAVMEYYDEFTQGYTLGTYTITYVGTSWVLALFSLFIYLFTSLTQVGAAFSWVLYAH
jgi:hypothetical protein